MWPDRKYIRMPGRYMHLLLLIILIVAAGCNRAGHLPKAENGQLDITSVNLRREQPVRLDGEWEFYWKQLYTPADFAARPPAMTGFIEVPVFWNAQKVNGQKLPWNGYGTYRLRIRKAATSGFLGIRVPDPNSAFRIWVNGKQVAQAGTVGTDKKTELPSLQPAVAFFAADGNELEIVLQVSNFFHHKAGVWQSLTLGTEETVMHERDASILLSMCLVGTFLILSIYNLFIFILRRVEYSAFIFSGLSLCFAIRTFVIEERPVLMFFPGLTTDMLHRIQYESIFAACVFFTGFVYSLTYKEFPRRVLNFIIAVSVVEFLVICFTPVAFYTKLLMIFQLKVLLQSFYSYYVIRKSIREKRKRAWLLFWLLSIIFVAGMNDVLYTNAVIHTGYQMQYYSFLILVVQAYIVATRISGAYYKFSKLSEDLEEANLGLEQKVAGRTLELELEKKKADDLLLNIMPAQVAHELKTKGRSETRAYEMATVMLIDMVGFTTVSEQVSAELLVAEIDECFKAFDEIIGEHRIEKIKTIGDAYLCAGGIPEPNDTHAADIVAAAIKINEYMAVRRHEKELNDAISFRVRTGIHSGPLVAGVVGIKKFSYDIWGDTVTIAAQMEQYSQPGKINISEATRNLLKDNPALIFTERAAVQEGALVRMWFLEEVKTKATVIAE